MGTLRRAAGYAALFAYCLLFWLACFAAYDASTWRPAEDLMGAAAGSFALAWVLFL